MNDYMEYSELTANLYRQRMNEINGRKVWFYLIASSIGNIGVVDYEEPGLEIKRKIFGDSYDKAERYFEKVCRQMISGKI